MRLLKILTQSKRKREAQFYEFIKDKSNVRKILVLRNGLLGDCVFITPVLERLSNTFPDATIDVIVSEQSKEILRHHPSIHSIRWIRSQASFQEQMKMYITLRHEHYDVALILESNTHYSIMSPLIQAKYVVTFQNSWDFLSDISFAWKDGVHHVESELETVRTWTTNANTDFPRLYVTEAEINKGTELLISEGVTERKRIFCFHPGCNEPDSVRQWVVGRYARLAEVLSELYQVQIVFTGVKRDRHEIAMIQKQMKHASVNLAGKTSLREFMAVLKLSKFVLGPDTGAIHIATALQIPSVMLMGYSDPVKTGPYDSGLSKVVRVKLPCSPCTETEPKPQQWNYCKDNRPATCMEQLTVEQVLHTIQEMEMQNYL
ncbi:MAG: glycosyltransferase family 9 protein [Ignavibacteriae bacterium]|nr:glycosyltransferase family 9 protein [Ignavibacteriota bacterium]